MSRCGRPALAGLRGPDEGQQIFADELRCLAAADPRVAAIAERAAEPVRVAVRGRRGVGRRTVAQALGGAGVAVATVPSLADVVVYVLAEVVKPEDTDGIAAVTASGRPILVVLNKADLVGAVPCARVAALTGVPTAPLIGLLAVTALEDRLDWAALQVLAAEPGGPGSADDFLERPHRLPREARRRLCDTLGLFGIARAVTAIRRGDSAAAVCTLLRGVSGVDAVITRLAAVGAEVRYRRMLDHMTELEALAVTDPDGPIGRYLSGDAVVSARMAAAVAVLDAAGLKVGPPDADPSAHLRRAVTWQRYSRGPMSTAYQACAHDVVRASLRRWSHVQGAR